MLFQNVDIIKKQLIDDDTPTQSDKRTDGSFRKSCRNQFFNLRQAKREYRRHSSYITDFGIIAICHDIGNIIDKKYNHFVSVVDTNLSHIIYFRSSKKQWVHISHYHSTKSSTIIVSSCPSQQSVFSGHLYLSILTTRVPKMGKATEANPLQEGFSPPSKVFTSNNIKSYILSYRCLHFTLDRVQLMIEHKTA